MKSQVTFFCLSLILFLPTNCFPSGERFDSFIGQSGESNHNDPILLAPEDPSSDTQSQSSNGDLSKSLLASTFRVPIHNRENRYYTMTFLVSSHQEPFEILIDTSAYATWIVEASCQNWDQKMLDCANPVAECQINADEQSIEISSGTGGVHGRVATINVAFRGDHKKGPITDFRLLMADKMVAESCVPIPDVACPKFDGVLGLAMPIQKHEDKFTYLASTFKKKGLIQKEIVSIYFNNSRDEDDRESELAFGGINPDLVNVSTVVWHKSMSPSLWAVNVDDYSLGDVSLSNFQVKAILDSGFPFIGIPNDSFEKLLEAFRGLYNVNCVAFEKLQLVHKCEGDVSNLPTLKIVIEGVPYHVKSKRYIVNGLLYVIPTPKYDEINLGLIFLRGFYFIHDYEEKAVGLGRIRKVGSVTPPPPPPPTKKDTEPTDKNKTNTTTADGNTDKKKKKGLTFWKTILWIGVAVLITVILAGFGLIIWNRFRRAKSSNMENMEPISFAGR